jgi:GR25 family glycosyltransferase involved in LPS biosynthesis
METTMVAAPVVLFVYNRLEHTRKTVQALAANDLAKDTDLFIYSDGAKDDKDGDKVADIRSYIDGVKGFKSVTVFKKSENTGLAKSITDGVTEIVNRFGRVVVLEDDIVTGRHFLKYINQALEVYKEHEKVMHISGWNFPMNFDAASSCILWRYMSCWGWATWADRWCYYKKDTEDLLSRYSKQDIDRLNLDGTANFWRQVKQNHHNKINTWAIFWYCSIFDRDGLCISPMKSLVNNIGMDDSGVHCTGYDPYKNTSVDEDVEIKLEPISENRDALECLKEYLNETTPSILTKVYYKAKQKYTKYLEHVM